MRRYVERKKWERTEKKEKLNLSKQASSNSLQNELLPKIKRSKSPAAHSLPINLQKQETICNLFRSKAQAKLNKYWAETFDFRLILDLRSEDWSVRESKLNGIIGAAEMNMSQMINDSNMFNLTQTDSWIKLVKNFSEILQTMAMDPVYLVYMTSLTGIKTLLANYMCFSEQDMTNLRDLIRPIVRIVLSKCTDNFSRLSIESVNFLADLSHGQSGKIAVGKKTGCSAQQDVTGLDFVLSCIFESQQNNDSHTNNWQRNLGRLNVLDKLMDIFPQSFYVSEMDNNHDGISKILKFTSKFLKNPHTNVRKMAERIHIRAIRIASHSPKMYKSACYSLHKTNSRLLSRLRDRTPTRNRSSDVPTLHQNHRRSSDLCSLPPLPLSSPIAKQSVHAIPKRQRPKPLPLKIRSSFESATYHSPKHISPLPRRCSEGIANGTECCFNYICHMHPTLLCDRVCETIRQKISFFPNTTPDLLNVIPEMANHHHQLPHAIMKPDSYREGVDWVVDKVLGVGGFSRCVLGKDVRSGRLMAVKQMAFRWCNSKQLDKNRAKILDEIEIMIQLDHPNVVHILGACELENGFNLFVQWMAGGSVADSLSTFGALSDSVILNYLKHILSGLEYLHENRILHRDLKGANLLIDSTGQHVRIADFGTAKRLAACSTLPDEFAQQIMGTIAFMAPEVLKGNHYGRSCDVWSVGCCVIEMATTKPPWSDLNNDSLFFTIALTDKPPPIPESVSEKIKDFALCCLQLNETDRPTVTELKKHSCFSE